MDSGWNFLAARKPRTINANIATTCAMMTGGSDPLGASAFKAGTF